MTRRPTPAEPQWRDLPWWPSFVAAFNARHAMERKERQLTFTRDVPSGFARRLRVRG